MARAKLSDPRVSRIHDHIQEAEPGAAEPAAAVEPGRLVGSRGGKTTVTDGGLMRKTTYFRPETWDAIEAAAKLNRCTAAEIVRRAVAAYLEES